MSGTIDCPKRKLYRDVEPGETLQAGDERINTWYSNWVVCGPGHIGRLRDEFPADIFRRPTDAVPRDEFDALHNLFAEAGSFVSEAIRSAESMNAELADLRQQLAELQSQPRLRRVTPEAMAELQERDKTAIIICGHDAAWVYRWSKDIRWTADRRPATRPTTGWFIDLATIPEITQ